MPNLKPDPIYMPLFVRGEPRITRFREKIVASPSYSFSPGEGRATAEYWIAGDLDNANVPNAALDFLGYSTIGILDNKKFVSRITPYDHPNFHDYLFADSIQKMVGDVPLLHNGPSKDVNAVAAYDEWAITLNFSARPYEVLSDAELMKKTGLAFCDESKLHRYVNVQILPTGRAERIPSGVALYWVGWPTAGVGLGPALMSNTGVVNIVEASVSITWYQIPATLIPWDAIKDCMGKTNSDAIGSANNTFYAFFAEGTLICLAPRISPMYRMANGRFAADVTYSFLYKYYGANSFLRWNAEEDSFGNPSTGPTYQVATRDGTLGGGKLYPAVAFNRLFWGADQPPV